MSDRMRRFVLTVLNKLLGVIQVGRPRGWNRNGMKVLVKGWDRKTVVSTVGAADDDYYTGPRRRE